MAQSSFSGSHFRPHRQPFQAGDIQGNPPRTNTTLRYGHVSPVYLPADPSTVMSNTPYFAKWGQQKKCPNPFEYVNGSFPSNGMEMPKAPLQRNNNLTTRRHYGLQ